MGGRLAKAAAIAIWAGYSVAFCVIGAGGGFDAPAALLLLYPPLIVLGLLVPRWWVATLPALLTVLLGRLNYELACPCYEDTLGFFYAIWAICFAVPGAALIIASVALRRGLDRWRGASAEPPDGAAA